MFRRQSDAMISQMAASQWVDLPMFSPVGSVAWTSYGVSPDPPQNVLSAVVGHGTRICQMSRPQHLRFAAASIGVALSATLSSAGASEWGKWFESLKVPGTATGCCSIADCHRTRARVDARGQWWALLTAEWWPAPKWVAVPPERVLAYPRSIDGEAYVCQTAGSPGGTTLGPINGQAYIAAPIDPSVRCFVPPDLGS